VTHPVHQLAQRGSGIGGELVTRMSQIMEMNARQSGGAKRGIPDSAAEVVISERLTFGASEQQAVLA